MNVEQIDIELAAIEDIAHGEVATKISKLRQKLLLIDLMVKDEEVGPYYILTEIAVKNWLKDLVAEAKLNIQSQTKTFALWGKDDQEITQYWDVYKADWTYEDAAIKGYIMERISNMIEL